MEFNVKLRLQHYINFFFQNEELQKKLDDFDKVIKVQRNMVAESSSLESEIRELRAKYECFSKIYNTEIWRIPYFTIHTIFQTKKIILETIRAMLTNLLLQS